MNNNHFKECTNCSKIWTTRNDFLKDPEVEVAGYQVNFEDLLLGFFLFHHSCGTTISIHPQKFVDLYTGPIFNSKKTGTSECPGFCLHQEELKPCPARCECAFVRQILWMLNTWKKATVSVVKS